MKEPIIYPLNVPIPRTIQLIDTGMYSAIFQLSLVCLASKYCEGCCSSKEKASINGGIRETRELTAHCVDNRRTFRRTYGHTDRQTNIHTDIRTDRRTLYGQTDIRRTFRRTYGQTYIIDARSGSSFINNKHRNYNTIL